MLMKITLPSLLKSRRKELHYEHDRLLVQPERQAVVF